MNKINEKTAPAATKYQAYFDRGQVDSQLRLKALQGASATVIAQISNFTISTLGTILLARLLSPDDFGLIAMVLIFSLVLQNFGTNGFTELIIQRPDISHRQVSTLFWINVIVNFILSLLLFAASPLLAWFYREPRLIGIISVISTSILFSALSTPHLALLQRNMQFHKTAMNTILASLLSVGVAVLLALYGWGYWALAVRWVLLPLITTIGAWLFCRWRPGLPAKEVGIKSMLKFSLSTYGNFVVDYFGRNIDHLLLGKYYGSRSLGFYDRAYQLSNMLPNQLVHPISNIAVATLSRVSDHPEKFHRSYLEVVSLLAFVGMPVAAILTLVGGDLILFLLGSQWAAAGPLMAIFGVSLGVKLIYFTHGWLHLSLGTPDRWLRWSLLSLTFTVVCFLVGLPFGMVGLTVAYSISFYFLIGPGLSYAGQPIRLTFTKIFSVIWKSFLASLAAGSACGFLLYSHFFLGTEFAGLPVWLRIILSTTLILVLYLLAISMLHRNTKPIEHFFRALREMIPMRTELKGREKEHSTE